MTHTLRNLILAFAICSELFVVTQAGRHHGHGIRHHRTRHNRYRRDISGQYHPELHGDKGHLHVHSHDETNDLGGHGEVHSITSTNGNEHSHISVFTSGGGLSGEKGVGGGGYDYPPPPAPAGPPPNSRPNCGCHQVVECDPSLRSFTELVVRTQATQLVCGTAYKLCCVDDPWEGYTDAFIHQAPCVPQEFCGKHYATSPTDVAEYGSIGPCAGHGTVRCLDNVVPLNPAPIAPAPIPVQINPEGPTHFVVPILSTPVIPEVPFVPHPPTSYGPPAPVEPTPVQPSGGYSLPAPVEPTPVQPSTGYGPPTPVEPTPVQPSTGYGPPAPVEPIPVQPTTFYGPPSVSYYVPTPIEPPAVSYGVPGVPYGRPLGFYGGGGYGGYPSRFVGGLYPGFGFRKHFSFSKGFGLF